MRPALALVLALATMGASGAAAASIQARVELNKIETVNNQCRLTFVVENKDKESIKSLKLDLAVFNPQHVVQRRLITELGPVHGIKTIVKTFALDGACGDIGSILVNDVTCGSGNDDSCLDGLELASRLKNVRLFK